MRSILRSLKSLVRVVLETAILAPLLVEVAAGMIVELLDETIEKLRDKPR